PALQPGDHYSLFLTGSAQAPQLQGQLSRTDPYTR
ncbi:cell division protein FtsQ, partial [Xanthomonas sp. Kuri4-3]